MYINNSIKKYLDDLAAKKPAPGGGSASALGGATGAGLISMVCNFTLGKERYKRFEKDIDRILSKAESIRKELMKLVDEDIKSYKKFAFSKKVDLSFKKALKVPFKICKLIHESIRLCPELVNKGNAMLVSDVGCAVELLEGAFQAALFNVDINLANIDDKDFINGIRKEIGPLKKEVSVIKDRVAESVNKILERK